MNLVGELLVGEYDITEALGHGATSVVYKAVRTTDKNVFAIKILHSYLVVNEEKRKRFEQEARALLLLSHPHIVKIHSFDKTTDDQPFFVMDFIPGQTLSDLVNGAPLTIPQSWKIFIEIADAMTHAHNRGVIHRSLKPGNIIMADAAGKQKAMVTDFGMAKLLPSSGEEIQELTAKGAIIGSPYYMSPEQCLGREIDARADIYSMGCLMYSCLTGVPPLKGEHVLDTMSKHVSEIPKTFDEAFPELKIPNAVQAIVWKCLAKRPEDRYASMELLKQDLARFEQGKRPRALSATGVGAPTRDAQSEQKDKSDAIIDEDKYIKIFLWVIFGILAALVIYAAWKSPQYKDPAEVELGKAFSDRLQTTHPISALALLKRADELHMLHRDQEAKSLYREAIMKAQNKDKDASPVDNEVLATAHYGLGMLLGQAKDWTQAEKELRLALYVQELSSSDTAAGKERIQIDLSYALMREGKWDDAKKLLEQVRKNASETLIEARALVMLSDISHANHKTGDTFAYTQKAIALLKGKGGLSRTLYCTIIARDVRILLDQKQYEKCIEAIKSALSERPISEWDENDAEAAIYLTAELGRVYACMGQTSEAIQACNKMLLTLSGLETSSQSRSRRVRASDASLIDTIAASQAIAGDTNAALRTLGDSEINDYSTRLGHVGTHVRILLYAKKEAEALRYLEQFKKAGCKQAQSKAEFLALKALCLCSSGKPDEALNLIDEAMDALKDTDDETMYYYCLKIKCEILRGLKRNEAVEVIEKSAGPSDIHARPFDFIVPFFER